MNRMQDLVGQSQGAVAKSLMEQIVGSGDRSDERVLDRQTSGVGLALTHRRHHILHLAAGQHHEIRPAATSRGLAERSLRALNGNAHW